MHCRYHVFFIGLQMITLKKINAYIKKLEGNIDVTNNGNTRLIDHMLETEREIWANF